MISAVVGVGVILWFMIGIGAFGYALDVFERFDTDTAFERALMLIAFFILFLLGPAGFAIVYIVDRGAKEKCGKAYMIRERRAEPFDPAHRYRPEQWKDEDIRH